MSEAHAGMMVTPSVKLVRPLGGGGMGSVWVADHLALRTQVVVKFIASALQDSREAQERFSREAAAAAQVKSPHVVQTLDHGITDQGVPYIVMELLEGQDLGAHLAERSKLPPELVLEIVAQLARALERAHERGIVHRDIKPGNIFLCDAGNGEVFVKLLDFGIAKGVDVPTLDSHTKTGAMIGSPYYMSPEQILGARGVDHRSDLWSVAVVAFEALTGARPFDAETMGGLAIKIHSEPLPLPTALVPSLSPAVDTWFQKACARNVEERFRSARELAEAFGVALAGQMPRSVELPRASTGSAPTSGDDPTLAAGAMTEAGIVRSALPAAKRGKLLATVAIMGLGLAVSFVAVRAIHGGEPRANVDGRLVAEPSAAARVNAASAPTAAPAPPAASPPVLTGLTAPEPAAADAVVPVANAAPAPGPAGKPASRSGAGLHTHKATTRAAPHPSPSSPTPLPSSTAASSPRPATSGHDIW